MKIDDATRKKFDEANIPWPNKIMVELKEASLRLVNNYMKVTLDEVARMESKYKTEARKHQMCAKLLTSRNPLVYSLVEFNKCRAWSIRIKWYCYATFTLFLHKTHVSRDSKQMV